MHFLCAVQAASRGYTECIKVLLQGGAGINLTDSSNRTALHLVNRKCAYVLLYSDRNAVTSPESIQDCFCVVFSWTVELVTESFGHLLNVYIPRNLTAK